MEIKTRVKSEHYAARRGYEIRCLRLPLFGGLNSPARLEMHEMRFSAGQAVRNFNNVRLRPDLFSGVRLNIEILIRTAELKRWHESGPLRVAKNSLSLPAVLAGDRWRRFVGQLGAVFAVSFLSLIR